MAANADVIAGRVVTRLGGSEGAVLVADDALVAATARLIAPVLIGPGATVAAGAEVGPETVVGAGSRILENAIVCRSVLFDDVTVGADASVVRSVIGRAGVVGVHANVSDSALGTAEHAAAGATLTGERRPG